MAGPPVCDLNALIPRCRGVRWPAAAIPRRTAEWSLVKYKGQGGPHTGVRCTRGPAGGQGVGYIGPRHPASSQSESSKSGRALFWDSFVLSQADDAKNNPLEGPKWADRAASILKSALQVSIHMLQEGFWHGFWNHLQEPGQPHPLC